jgi:PleD family two-component response regulator
MTARAGTVLVGEDDDDIRALVVYRLERSGYEVVQARDGEEALRLAAGCRPDLAILDVRMPDLDRDEVTRRLRRDDADDPTACDRARRAVPGVGREPGPRGGRGRPPPEAVQSEELRARVQAILGRRRELAE